MMYIKSLLFSLLIYFGSSTPSVYAQEIINSPKDSLSDFSQLSPEEYKKLQLPPLQTLLENAQKNPRLQQSYSAVKNAEYDLKIEKRKWLSYLSARAGYTYGILGTYVDHETELSPLTTTYTGSNQHSYSIGASLSIPISDLVSRGTSVKKQREVLKQAEYNQEIVWDLIKNEIIELYFNLHAGLETIKLRIETLTFYNANYKILESDFINGRVTPNDLAGMKREQKNALEEFIMAQAALNTMLLKLEILTNTKLINK